MVVDVGGDCNFEREYTLTAQFPAPSPKKKPPCFSGLNTVNVQNKGEILLQDLRIGDYVQTEAGDYSRVFSFAHLDTQEPTTFLQIQTPSSNNTPLEITGEHILFANGGLVRADSVEVGDKLSSGTIERIGSVQRVGFYSPTTESGEFVASNTRVSCFAAVFDVPVGLQHELARALYAPLKFACKWNFDVCANESYTNGFSSYLWTFVPFAIKVWSWSAWMQGLLLILASPVLALAYCLLTFPVQSACLFVGAASLRMKSRKVIA